jgi:putative ABC transport system ATP-binding protein
LPYTSRGERRGRKHLENVAWPLRLASASHDEEQERVSELIAFLGLEARVAHHPSELSGGEQQRTAIARALVNAPEVLLADEPNLDSNSGARVLDLLERVQKERGVALVVVTHDPSVAARSHRTLEMRDGRLVSS